MTNKELVLEALYRKSFDAFAERAMTIVEPGTELKLNWHHRAIGWKLTEVWRGKIRRLAINQPPKTLKTFLTAIAFVAWLLMQDPSLKIAIISYDDTLSSTQARHVRRLLRSSWFRKVAPQTRISAEKDTETLFETTAGGEVRALSVQGGITGFGFDYIILDDPIKASLATSETERRKLEEIYASSIANRWRNPAQGKLILVMQRLHIDDFTAFFLRSNKTATHLCIPAIAPRDLSFQVGPDEFHIFKKGDLMEPDRLSHDYLAEMRAGQGARHFDAQYLQNPSPEGGRVVEPAWFRRFEVLRRHDLRIISIDPAFTENRGDFSAALVANLVGDQIDLIHGERVQMEFSKLARWVKALDAAWRPDMFLIEGIGSGRGFCQHLRSEGLFYLEWIETHAVDKLRRMEAVSPRIESRRVGVPWSGQWVELFLDEIERFPGATHDDWADALSQLLYYHERTIQYAREYHRRRNPPPPQPEVAPTQRRSMHYNQWPNARFLGRI